LAYRVFLTFPDCFFFPLSTASGTTTPPKPISAPALAFESDGTKDEAGMSVGLVRCPVSYILPKGRIAIDRPRDLRADDSDASLESPSWRHAAVPSELESYCSLKEQVPTESLESQLDSSACL
jgi:hypothetical protein